MKRLFGILLLTSACAFAHEGGAEQGDKWLKWKIIDFGILAAGLGYLIGKSAPAFFRDRTSEIQKGITEATAMKREAETRAAEIEKQVASLGADVENLRAQSTREMAAEAERTKYETQRLIDKIQAQAGQEIASAVKHASLDLQAYSAKLALDLAEGKIRSQMTPGVQDTLVKAFVDDLHNNRVHQDTH